MSFHRDTTTVTHNTAGNLYGQTTSVVSEVFTDYVYHTIIIYGVVDDGRGVHPLVYKYLAHCVCTSEKWRGLCRITLIRWSFVFFFCYSTIIFSKKYSRLTTYFSVNFL